MPRPTAPRPPARSAVRTRRGLAPSTPFSAPTRPGFSRSSPTITRPGLRGKLEPPLIDPAGQVDWNIGLFRTDLDNDILTVPSDIISTGFFQNVGDTRRQGIEASVAYKDPKWQISANYSLIDATFHSAITLSSPDNPFADANGDIQVRPGDHLPGIPQHRFKVNVDYAITDKWTVGGDLIFASSQYYFNDQSNQNPQLPGYIVANLAYVVQTHRQYRGLCARQKPVRQQIRDIRHLQRPDRHRHFRGWRTPATPASSASRHRSAPMAA